MYTKKTKIVLNAIMTVLVFAAFVLNVFFMDDVWGKWAMGTVCLVGIVIASVTAFLRFIHGRNAIWPCCVIGALTVPIGDIFTDSLNWPPYLCPVCSIVFDLLVMGVVIWLSYRYAHRQDETCSDM